MRRTLSSLVTLACLILVWMSYDNVLSDVAPTQALAEVAACKMKDCKKQHGVTQTTRAPTGDTFEITFQDGVVTVACHRESYVFGPMQCQAR